MEILMNGGVVTMAFVSKFIYTNALIFTEILVLVELLASQLVHKPQSSTNFNMF